MRTKDYAVILYHRADNGEWRVKAASNWRGWEVDGLSLADMIDKDRRFRMLAETAAEQLLNDRTWSAEAITGDKPTAKVAVILCRGGDGKIGAIKNLVDGIPLSFPISPEHFAAIEACVARAVGADSTLPR